MHSSHVIIPEEDETQDFSNAPTHTSVHTKGELHFPKTHSATKLRVVIATEFDQCNQGELGKDTENMCLCIVHVSAELSSCMMTRERVTTHLSALYTFSNLKRCKKISVVLCTVIFKIWNVY